MHTLRVLGKIYEPKSNRRQQKIIHGAVSYFVLYGRHYCGDEIEDEKGGACSTHERINMHKQFWWRNHTQKDHLVNLNVDDEVI